jgi:hypothetical protein
MRYSVVEQLTRKTALNTRKEIEEILQNRHQELQGCKEWIQGTDFVSDLSQFLFACYLYGYECSFNKYNSELAA